LLIIVDSKFMQGDIDRHERTQKKFNNNELGMTNQKKNSTKVLNVFKRDGKNYHFCEKKMP
jgi:hypothetical protein